ELISLVSVGTINGKTAKDVFVKLYHEGGSAKKMVESAGLSQITDAKAIEAICKKIISDPNLQKQLEKYRSGHANLFGFFVGLVMKVTKGRANPELVNEILKRMLSGAA